MNTANANMTKPKNSKQASSGRGIFFDIGKRFKIESYFLDGFPVEYVPKILFVMFLSLLYIGNTHYAEKTVRKIDKLQLEVEDLRADYITLKSDLMFSGKQSEVARKVKIIGLKESLIPPTRVIIEEGEY